MLVAAIIASTSATYAQHLPQINNRPLMPESWLLGTGQAWFYKVNESSQGRILGQRDPSSGEITTVNEIQRIFDKLPSMALLLGDGDKIVKLNFKSPANDYSTFMSASIDKTITAMSTGVAICDGKIKLTTKVKEVLPEFSNKDIGESTLRDNLMMASGTKDAFSDSQSLTKEQLNNLMTGKSSLMDFMKGPLGDFAFWSKPGKFSYKSQDPIITGMMVSAAYGKNGKDFREWQDEYFFTKVQTGERRIHGRDQFGYAWTEGNTRMTIKDWARFAIFVQESRKKNDCYGDFVREATTTQIKSNRQFSPMYGGYGYFTWTDNNQLPNTYSAIGYGGQSIVWSSVNDKYLIIFSTSVIMPEVHSIAKLWLESK